jgi:hypothetical protein
VPSIASLRIFAGKSDRQVAYDVFCQRNKGARASRAERYPSAQALTAFCAIAAILKMRDGWTKFISCTSSIILSLREVILAGK